MAVTEETGGATVMDETYEFSAPRFFDFIKGETVEESQRVELWFDTALSYAPSRTFLFSLLFLCSYTTLINRLHSIMVIIILIGF